MAEDVPKYVSGGFLTNIVLEIVQSRLNIALVVAIAFLAYKILKRCHPPEHQLSVEELKKFDGTQEDGRVLVGDNGNVYDVTKGNRFYETGGPYAAFAGRDASRGLATFSVARQTDGYVDLSDLNSTKMESVREWEAQFKGGNLLPMEQWQQRCPGGAGQGLRQLGPQLMKQQQQQTQLGAGPMEGGTPPVRPGAAGLNNPGNAMMHKEALEQLMQTLQSPHSPDQQLQLLQILKSNPQLMAALIKQRQAQAQAQQGAGAGVAGASPQQLQHMLSQQQTSAQHQNRMQMLRDQLTKFVEQL